MDDLYRNFGELCRMESEGSDFHIYIKRRKGSTTVILAPHGGGIELGTSEVARKVAANDLSLATFDGEEETGNSRLHITSTNFDEPQCLELVQEANSVVAIHGESSAEQVVFLGGRDKALGAHLQVSLEKHGYSVKTHEKSNLQGVSEANICNRGRRGAGVQLELSSGLRKTFFESLKAEGRQKPTGELTKFAAAVRDGLRLAGVL